MQHRAQMAGQGALGMNVSWKVRLKRDHGSFPEHGTLELRHKGEMAVAMEDWERVLAAISEEKARGLGVKAHMPTLRLHPWPVTACLSF